jgi:hypothetical protein
VTAGDRVDAWRDRRREQHSLAILGSRLEDRLDIVGEAHVEHLVRLIQHDGPHIMQAKRPTADMVQRAPRCCDHDIDPAFEHL